MDSKIKCMRVCVCEYESLNYEKFGNAQTISVLKWIRFQVGACGKWYFSTIITVTRHHQLQPPTPSPLFMWHVFVAHFTAFLITSRPSSRMLVFVCYQFHNFSFISLIAFHLRFIFGSAVYEHYFIHLSLRRTRHYVLFLWFGFLYQQMSAEEKLLSWREINLLFSTYSTMQQIGSEKKNMISGTSQL